MTAARQQGWTVTLTDGAVSFLSPDNLGFVATREIFDFPSQEPTLRAWILALSVAGGLWWPWTDENATR
ncbi:hypothetical protein [Pseudonocardia sp. T1-2H]|uniref:hypothetical protein n=1 Tax=Pseudonocardia sp. T1-2H TaxID=3128899 RepID=UPI003101B12A